MAVVRSMPVRRVIQLAATVVVFGAMLAAKPAAGTPAPSYRSVTFGPVTFHVPSAWLVVDVRADPSRCVRFDRHAVYLGTQAQDARCPARAVGRADAIQVEALSGKGGASLAALEVTAAGLVYRRVPGTDMVRMVVAEFPTVGILFTAPYLRDPSVAERIIASVTLRPGATPKQPVARPAAPAAAPAAPATVSLQGYGGAIHEGLGVDTCTAPSEASLRAWLASPYRLVGIYIGGVNRGCAQPNLTRAWVAAVEAMGWRYIPTYVGLQAPCARQHGFDTIDPAHAAEQGKASADDAAEQAAALELGQGAPVYFDMEGYDSTDADCNATVETFLSAFVGEMHAKHLTAGVYGSVSSTISQLAVHYHDKTLHRPDDIWMAHWDGRKEVFGDPYVPDDLWPTHQRLHQYQGQHYETWGGVEIFVDNDVADGAVVGPRRNLVFAGHGGGPRDIYTVGPDGIGLKQLTTATVDDYAPALSPDATKIAYTSASGGDYNVWIMNADGTSPRRLAYNAAFDGYPSWSPDGSKLVFQSTRSGRENLWVVNADGTGVRQLTSTSTADDVRPAWSPGGATIAFHSVRTGNNDVWTIGADGAGLRRLTWRTTADRDPSWSPDGSLIAFESDRTGNFEIFTISPKGAGATQVGGGPASDYAATWSPDSRRIVFASTRTGTTQVFVMDRDGANAIQVTFGGISNQLPSWGS